ncbi:hypothetical protein [Spirosoma flavum]|uniref:Glycosyl transferase n=1 Tax=Spirosoma flavum TaxID=2048557 RepID=A0ABW6AQ71_9BACT
MLLTICTIRQLPHALALGDSFCHHSANSADKPFVLIGLVDDPAHLPTDFVSPYPLLPIHELLTPTELTALSTVYTPTEFAAACKPLFITELFRRYPDADKVVYADPNIQFLGSFSPILDQLVTANAILTPFITSNPGDMRWPDEKFFQNIGLYSSDFLAFRRSDETDRLLTWWDNRVRERAYVDFCEGLCLDQLWLMHVPIFFRDVLVVKNPGWHVALWNLPERAIRQVENGWLVTGPGAQNQPLQFVNFKGLANPDEGFFPHQNRIHLSTRPEVVQLLTTYRQALIVHKKALVDASNPAYGKQPEPVILRGWRYATVQSLKRMTRFLDRVSIPALT